MPEGLAAAVILFFGALISGAGGFGFALLSLTLLSLVFDPKSAVAFMAVQTLTQNVIQSIGLRRYFHLKELMPLLAGGVIGVPAGVLFLKGVNPVVIQRALGALVLVFVITLLFKGRHVGLSAPHPRWANANLPLLVGFGGGMLMGAFLSGGPPLVMYQLWKGEQVLNQGHLAGLLPFLQCLYAGFVCCVRDSHRRCSPMQYQPVDVYHWGYVGGDVPFSASADPGFPPFSDAHSRRSGLFLTYSPLS